MKVKKLSNIMKVKDNMKIKKFLYGFCGVVIISGIVFIISWGGRPYGEKLNEGDIAMRSIYSPFNFTAQGEINKEVTEKLRQEAAEEIKDIYEININSESEIHKELDRFFKDINLFKQKEFLDETDKVSAFNEKFNTNFDLEQINLLLNFKNLDELHNITEEVIDEIFSKSIASSSLLAELVKKDIKTIIIYRNDEEIKKDVSEILSLSQLNETTHSTLQSYFPKDKKLIEVLTGFLTKIVNPNIKFSSELTEEKIVEAKASIPPVYNRLFVKKNELIVEKGEKVNQRKIKLLSTIEKIQKSENKIWYTMGTIGIIALFSLILILYFYFYRPSMFNNRNLLLVGLLSFILVVLAKGVTISPLSSYFIPLASISMLVAILLNFNIAVLVTGLLSFISGLIVGDGLTIAIVFFCGALLSIFILRKIRSRLEILQAALVVSITNFIMICMLGIFRNLDYRAFLTQGLWGIGNGFLSGLLVMGLLPLLEYIFNITTNISLLEQSDLNHPLLKKMILRAPGTYHHSLIVGNLSEAACETIGANSLLARVGSCFHDIGKIEKAEYFSENQIRTQSKHDKLTPDMSKLIIIKHVKDGIELAKKYKLRQAIIDIIAQHHGTGLVFYFFQRALDEKVDDSEVEEEYYRYSGPKPQTKEAAVVLLADSVEAASRALSSPTPARIKVTVRKVINNKFIDGQLDECDLTLRELNRIAAVFIRILTGIFHSRIEYPEKLQKKSSQNDSRRKK